MKRVPHPTFTVLASALVVVVGAALLVADSPSSLPTPAETSVATITARELRASVGFLASDAVAGRGLGDAGNDVAAQYLAATLQAHDIAPLDEKGYLRAFDLTVPSLGPRNSLTVVERGPGGVDVKTRYEPGPDVLPVHSSPSREVNAPLAFAGFGIQAPELGRDDYAGLDVTGRIVIVFAGVPSPKTGPDPYTASLTEHGDLNRKAEVAAAHGAVGLLLVSADGDRRLPDVKRAWPDKPSVRQMNFDLAGEVASVPVMRISGALASTLLKGTDSDSSTLDDLHEAYADRGNARDRVPVRIDGREVTLISDVHHAAARGFNVVGWLEGRDAALKREPIVVGAHFDHDGIDADGRIYNGADDNASGTAGVLEIADAFAQAAATGLRPRRPVVFALWNGEEKGELGARAFVEQAARVGLRITANLNMDMIGRDEDVPEGDPRFSGLKPTRASDNSNALHLIGYSRSPALAALVRDENVHVGLTLREMLDDSTQQLLRRSDQWPFVQQRVPAIFFFTGLHPDYHTPQDDADKLNYGKMERIVRLVYRVAWRLADAQSLPAFVDPPTTDQ